MKHLLHFSAVYGPLFVIIMYPPISPSNRSALVAHQIRDTGNIWKNNFNLHLQFSENLQHGFPHDVIAVSSPKLYSLFCIIIHWWTISAIEIHLAFIVFDIPCHRNVKSCMTLRANQDGLKAITAVKVTWWERAFPGIPVIWQLTQMLNETTTFSAFRQKRWKLFWILDSGIKINIVWLILTQKTRSDMKNKQEKTECQSPEIDVEVLMGYQITCKSKPSQQSAGIVRTFNPWGGYHYLLSTAKQGRWYVW